MRGGKIGLRSGRYIEEVRTSAVDPLSWEMIEDCSLGPMDSFVLGRHNAPTANGSAPVDPSSERGVMTAVSGV
jgi:hypothetical protein